MDLWTYNGCDNYVNNGKFYPTGITETSADMILVSYIFNYAIHMLAGDVISYRDVKTLGIKLPLSLSFDSNGILWVGCNTWARDKESKAKIFAVKLI